MDTLQILKDSDALLEGHFLLTSGKHSKQYVQCAKLLRFPDKAEKILKPVADQLKDMQVDLLVGPAMGGILVAYEIGRQLGKEAIFTLHSFSGPISNGGVLKSKTARELSSVRMWLPLPSLPWKSGTF